jgi:MFS family permease
MSRLGRHERGQMTGGQSTVLSAHRRARLAASAAFFVQGLTFASMVTRLPAFSDRFGLDAAHITVVLLATAIAAGVGSVFAGMASTKSGGAPWLRAGLFVVVAAAVIAGLASSRWMLYGSFVVYGLGVGAVDAMMNLHGLAVQERYRRSIMTSFHAVWSVAGIIGALLTGVAAAAALQSGTSLTVVAASGLAIAAVASPSLLDTRNVVAETPKPVDASGSAGHVPWRPILPIGAAVVCFFVADAATANWSALYLHNTLGSTENLAVLAFAGYQAAAVIGRVGGDFIVRRLGAVPVVRMAGLIGTAGLSLVVAAPTPAAAIGGFAVLGLGISVIEPLSFSAAGRLDRDRTGIAVARVNIFNYIGYLVGGALVGAVASIANLRAAYVLPLALASVIALLARGFGPGVSDPTEDIGAEAPHSIADKERDAIEFGLESVESRSQPFDG